MPDDAGLLDILLMPIVLPARGFIFLLEQIRDAADRELFDPENLERKLMEVRMLYELGEIGEEEYSEAERAISARLGQIRRRGAQEGR